MSKRYLTITEVYQLAKTLAQDIAREQGAKAVKIAGIPRGGVPVTFLLAAMSGLMDKTLPDFVDNIEDADILVDDLYDSGATYRRYKALYPNKAFYVLIDKRELRWMGQWIVFPWEKDTASSDDSIVGTLTNRLKELKVPYNANDNISQHIEASEFELLEEEVAVRMQGVLDALLIDRNDHNSKGTAKRVAKMYCREIFHGRFAAAPRITSFPNAKGLDELYCTGPISVRSTCSHHLCPILGSAWIGIIPGDRVIGLSKFNRVIDWLCTRPQIQEELAVQIADELERLTLPKGLAVVIKAKHTCMSWRGVRESEDALMTTSVMRGVLRENPEARAEFLSLIK